MIENIFDLRYNIAALVIAIIREDIAIPEEAFAVISGQEYKVTTEDIEDMETLKQQGYTYRQIGKIYGKDKDFIYARMRRRKRMKVS